MAQCLGFLLTLFLVIQLTSQHRLLPLTGGFRFRHHVLDEESLLYFGTEFWFNQTLDHFDLNAQPTLWSQRYYQRWTYVDNSSLATTPIFLMLGGEGEATGWGISKSEAVDSYAAKYGALLLLLEHRFYGQSRPTVNLSTGNLQKYLSADQALADAANFIVKFKVEHNFGPGNKVVAFGGSYSGMLATWLRAEYPEIISGSIASSAPILAQFDFSEYFEVVTRDLERHDCLDEVKAAFDQIWKLLKKEEWNLLSKQFKTCVPVNGTNELDVQSFVSELTSPFAEASQYNSSHGQILNLPKVCGIMTNLSYSPLENLAILWADYAKANDKSCLENSFAEMIKNMSSVEYQKHPERQWTFQTCNEFGFFQTTSSSKQPFGDGLPLSWFVKMCSDLFGYDQEMINSKIDAINQKYGGLQPNATNVLLPNGDTDPWHRLGLTGAFTSTVEGFLIPNASHCADMSAQSVKDPKELREARIMTMKRIGEFLL